MFDPVAKRDMALLPCVPSGGAGGMGLDSCTTSLAVEALRAKMSAILGRSLVIDAEVCVCVGCQQGRAVAATGGLGGPQPVLCYACIPPAFPAPRPLPSYFNAPALLHPSPLTDCTLLP